MTRPAKITTPFPSVLETAKRLGVSKRDVEFLSELAERSVVNGAVLKRGEGHDSGGVLRGKRKARTGRNPVTGEPVVVPARKPPKTKKHPAVPSEKKN